MCKGCLIQKPKHIFFIATYTYTDNGFAAHPFYRFIIFKLQWAEQLVAFLYSYDLELDLKIENEEYLKKQTPLKATWKNENECPGEAGRVNLSLPGFFHFLTALRYYDFGGK